MRILHVAEALDSSAGGSSQAISRMADAVARAGHEASVAYRVTRTRGRSELLSKTEVREAILPNRWPARDLSQLIAEHDLVHVHGVWELVPWIARRAAIRGDRPFVSSAHGALSRWSLRHGAVKKHVALVLYERPLLKRTPVFIATSAHEREELLEQVPDARVEIVPHGIDVPERQSAPRGRHVVGFLGRLHPVKALEPLVEAVATLASRIPDLTLELAGPSSPGFDSWLERLLERGGGRVRRVGALDDSTKWDFLARCSVVALPSFFENFGLAAGEALAVGTPVVVGRATAWGEIERLGFGAVVEPEASSIADGLARVLENPEVAREAGCRAPEWIRTNYSWARVATELERVYASVGKDR